VNPSIVTRTGRLVNKKELKGKPPNTCHHIRNNKETSRYLDVSVS
jgi:hypothetical protein